MPCLALSALIPAMNPGRVTRSAMVLGSWQSTQATGCWISGWPLSSFMFRASLVRHAGDRSKPFCDVALADEAVQGEDRRVALQARAGLLLLGHAARLLLIEERVGVAAPVAVVDGKGVAGEDAPEPRVAVELLLRGAGVARAEAAPAVLGRRRQRRLEVASRTGAASSGPTPSGPSCPRSPRRRARTAGAPPACARRCW